MRRKFENILSKRKCSIIIEMIVQCLDCVAQ